MEAKDIMTADVITVTADSTLFEAIQTLLDNSISGVPVCDASGALVGIVTEKYLLAAQDYFAAKRTKVNVAMTSPTLCISEDTPVEKIIDIFVHEGVKRVPVVRDDKIVGVVARRDVLRSLMNTLVA